MSYRIVTGVLLVASSGECICISAIQSSESYSYYRDSSVAYGVVGLTVIISGSLAYRLQRESSVHVYLYLTGISVAYIRVLSVA